MGQVLLIVLIWFGMPLLSLIVRRLKRHSVNTFGRNVGLIKTFLNYALREKHTLNDKFKLFKAKRESHKSSCFEQI